MGSTSTQQNRRARSSWAHASGAQPAIFDSMSPLPLPGPPRPDIRHQVRAAHAGLMPVHEVRAHAGRLAKGTSFSGDVSAASEQPYYPSSFWP